MTAYVVIMVDPDQLVDSPQQPASRCALVGPMNALQNSIKNQGLQYPPLVIAVGEHRYQIIDGHRRVRAMKGLKYPQIPVMLTQGRPAELFAAVSGLVQKMKAHEWAQVYLHDGAVPPGATRTAIKMIDETCGREFLKKMADDKVTPTIWPLSHRVLKALGLNDSERKSVLKWLASVTVRNVDQWLKNGNNVDELRLAYQQNRTPTY